jgi:hypothetical protein
LYLPAQGWGSWNITIPTPFSHWIETTARSVPFLLAVQRTGILEVRLAWLRMVRSTLSADQEKFPLSYVKERERIWAGK